MDLADEAFTARVRGEIERSHKLFRLAFEKESNAARAVAYDTDFEPTRSVLLRSAASLALDCGELREAERLISLGLAGSPPDDVADEMRDLLDRVQFHRHLELRGVSLAPEEFQLALAGPSIGFGVAPSDAVVSRVTLSERLLVRTAERKAGRPFRESGPPPRFLAETVELFLSAPRGGSFAVTFRVGRPKDQIESPELVGTTALVDEMIECLELYEEGNEPALRRQIPDDAYFNNFTAIANQLAPDGKDINLVGFTTERYGRRKMLGLKRVPEDRRRVRPLHSPESRISTVTGRLLFADERYGQNVIRLVDERSEEYRIAVPPGMMSDIVKPLWEDLVTVTGTRRYHTIHLEDIRRADVIEDREREVAG